MGKRTRGSTPEPPQPKTRPSSPFNNPFGALSGLRDELPPVASQPAPPPPPPPQPSPRQSGLDESAKLVVQREKKGRAGKTVTRVSGLPPEGVEEVARRMKSALGCGATLEGDDLVLLGSLVDQASRWLEREGARKVVVSGGESPPPPSKRPPAPASAPFESERVSSSKDGTHRADLERGQTVDIVLKQDQRTGSLTRGVLQDILTRSPTHPHGIKVRLADGSVGRVKHVIESSQR